MTMIEEGATVSPELAAATLACLPDMTPARLRALVAHHGGPCAAYTAVTRGAARAALAAARLPGCADDHHRLARRWRDAIDAVAVRDLLTRRRTRVWIEGADDYPILEAVPDSPVVLFGEGDVAEVLEQPRVAVVGTRAATPHGLDDARELGAVLAESHVTVVSGLAIGIDGAAHEGALANGGAAVGVIATGLDVVYPRRHASLTARVKGAGLVLGEQGFGVQPRRGLFPIRNRIIAALADVVVVVEATIGGGARITAQYAMEYGRTVMAVPGSRRNGAAAGTNALIVDGAQPLVDWGDVLVALGLSSAATRTKIAAPPRPAPSPDAAAVLAALGGECATPDQLASRARLDVGRTAVAIAELHRNGWVERAQGAIWPR
jgi:DNA processing protein